MVIPTSRSGCESQRTQNTYLMAGLVIPKIVSFKILLRFRVSKVRSHEADTTYRCRFAPLVFTVFPDTPRRLCPPGPPRCVMVGIGIIFSEFSNRNF